MIVIEPVALSAAMLVSSNAGPADPAYADGVSYALGQRVFLQATGKTYECVQTPALGKAPDLQPLYWMEASPSNRWAMFDAEVSTATVMSGDIVATIHPDRRFDSVSLHGLRGDTVTITQRTSLGVVVYTQTRQIKEPSSGWMSYVFYQTERTQRTDLIFTGLSPIVGIIEIHVHGPVTACAAVVVGRVYELGDLEMGPTTGIIDYSRKDTNAAGVQTFRQGRYSRRASLRLSLPLGRYNAVSALLARLRAKPCVWVGDRDSGEYQPLTIFGFYRDFSIEVSYPTYLFCSLEIEGLT